MTPGGDLRFSPFHSGEDRLVKQALHEGLETGLYADAPADPIRPAPDERRDKPRSAPARLRWARRAAATEGG